MYELMVLGESVWLVVTAADEALWFGDAPEAAALAAADEKIKELAETLSYLYKWKSLGPHRFVDEAAPTTPPA